MGQIRITKLRVGVLLESFQMPAWYFTMLKCIHDSDYASLSLVVLKESARQPLGFLNKFVSQFDHLLYHLYTRLDQRLFPVSPNAFAPINAEDLFKDVPVVKVRVRETRFCDYVSDEDSQAVMAHDLDVLIRVGFRIIKGNILHAARFGIWSYHHGDNLVNRGAPAGFWEVFERHVTTGSILQQLSDELDGGAVICRSYSGTNCASVLRNRNQCYWKSSSFLPRKLRELHQLGETAFVDALRKQNRHPDFFCHRLYRTPSNREFAPYLWRWAWDQFKTRLSRQLFHKQWILQYSFGPLGSHSFRKFGKIIPPADRFWADPHVVYRDGKYFIFVEEFLYKARRGRIAVIEMSSDGSWKPPVVVLEKPYHLAYPFVFQWEGEYYMMPDSSWNSTVERYRCVDFPYKWELESVLMKGLRAPDPTLFHHEGLWWLFVNAVEVPGSSSYDELFLFYADHPLSQEWRPHPCNPVVSDVRRARPAGGLFRYNGGIYRPSQDCSITYGYGIRISEVLALTPKYYEEREVAFIEPKWDPRISGTHTISHAGGLTVIDALWRRIGRRTPHRR